jgi:hypothetical protein
MLFTINPSALQNSPEIAETPPMVWVANRLVRDVADSGPVVLVHVTAILRTLSMVEGAEIKLVE